MSSRGAGTVLPASPSRGDAWTSPRNHILGVPLVNQHPASAGKLGEGVPLASQFSRSAA
jgi:hypothetical protein